MLVVDEMVAAGVIDEVRAAHAAGASPSARQALGLRRAAAGDVDAMKRRTRNYAKRQLTWMRKLPGAQLVDVTGAPAGRRRARTGGIGACASRSGRLSATTT